MNEQDPAMRRARIRREALLLHYVDALERGDHDAIARLLAEAQTDVDTERDLWEMHLAFETQAQREEADEMQRSLDQDARLVRDLAASHFSSPVSATPLPAPAPDPSLPPLTVGDVAADLRGRHNEPQTRALLARLEQNKEQLGEDVSLRGVRALLQKLGLGDAGRRFVDAFHDAAFALTFQRQQRSALRLAATRRQNPSVQGGSSARGLREQPAPLDHQPRVAEETAVYQTRDDRRIEAGRQDAPSDPAPPISDTANRQNKQDSHEQPEDQDA